MNDEFNAIMFDNLDGVNTTDNIEIDFGGFDDTDSFSFDDMGNDEASQLSLFNTTEYDVGCITLKLKHKEIRVYYTQTMSTAKEFQYEFNSGATFNEDATTWLLPEAAPIANTQLFVNLLSNPTSTVKVSPKEVISAFKKDKFENTLLHNHLLKIETEM